MHVAVQQHNIEAVDVLINAGVDLMVYNSAHFSPLMEAAKNGFYA